MLTLLCRGRGRAGGGPGNRAPENIHAKPRAIATRPVRSTLPAASPLPRRCPSRSGLAWSLRWLRGRSLDALGCPQAGHGSRHGRSDARARSRRISRIARAAGRVARRIAGEDRLGGDAARHRGRQDALGGDRMREAERIADEQRVVAVRRCRGAPDRTGSTSGPSRARAAASASSGRWPAARRWSWVCAPGARGHGRVQCAAPDVEPLRLGHVPAVAGDVVEQHELGLAVVAHAACARPRSRRAWSSSSCTPTARRGRARCEQARDGAVRAAGADQVAARAGRRRATGHRDRARCA